MVSFVDMSNSGLFKISSKSLEHSSPLNSAHTNIRLTHDERIAICGVSRFHPVPRITKWLRIGPRNQVQQ